MYQARIGKLVNVRSFPKADRIKLAACFGSQIVVDLNAKDGDLVIFFDNDGQLSEEYCKENNLFNKPEMNKDPEAKCGFFDHRRRVRAQTFRSEKSEAYVANLNTLSFTRYDISKLKEGDAFSELNGIPICNKYFTKATKKQISNESKTQKGYNKEALKKLFPEHIDTGQLKYVDDKDLVGLITITLKMEGTCLFEDTDIITENGTMKIKDIVNSKFSGNILSYNCITNQTEWKKVSNHFIYDNIDNWYEIELENGTKCVATHDHLIWLPELQCYRALKDLKIGDSVLIT